MELGRGRDERRSFEHKGQRHGMPLGESRSFVSCEFSASMIQSEEVDIVQYVSGFPSVTLEDYIE